MWILQGTDSDVLLFSSRMSRAPALSYCSDTGTKDITRINVDNLFVLSVGAKENNNISLMGTDYRYIVCVF